MPTFPSRRAFLHQNSSRYTPRLELHTNTQTSPSWLLLISFISDWLARSEDWSGQFWRLTATFESLRRRPCGDKGGKFLAGFGKHNRHLVNYDKLFGLELFWRFMCATDEIKGKAVTQAKGVSCSTKDSIQLEFKTLVENLSWGNSE